MKYNKTVEQVQLNYMQKVVRTLMKDTNAWPFLKPVDVKGLNLQDYYDVIKNPMDLSTIKKRLESKHYLTADECIYDVCLMFSNCYIYNIIGDVVVKFGQKLEHTFLTKLNSLPYEDITVKEIEIPKEKEKKIDLPKIINKPTPTPLPKKIIEVKFPPVVSSKKLDVLDMSKNIQRRESTRTIKKPKNDTDLFSEKEKRLKLNDNMKGCLNIIKELLSRKHADYCWHFHEPVNIKIVSDYLSVIERPMDFTTILKKINNGEYSSPRLFVDDVRLVFTNCYRYNDEDSILVNSAQKSQRVFEYRLSRVPNLSDFLSITPSCINSTSEDQLTFDSNKLIELQQDVQNINNKISKMIDEKSGNNTYRIINGNLATNGTKLSVSKRVRQNSISNTIKKPKLSNIETNKITTNKTPKSATVEPISDILINGQSKVITSEINPKKMCPSFSDVDSVHNYEDDDDDENDDCSIMTYDQKRQLSLDINKLPANHLGEIVEILQHNDERLREDHPEEIEIDFETLQSKTLKQLQKYVADFYKKKNKPYKLPKQNVSSREEAQQLKKIELERRLDEVNSKLFYSGNKKFFKKPHKSNELNLSEDSDSSECSDKVDNDVKCNTNSDEPEKLFKDKTVPDQDPRDKATLLRIEQKRKENAELLENRRVIFEAERAQILAEAAKKDLPLKAKSEQEHSNEEILAARDKLRKEKLEIRKNMMSNQNSKMDLTQQGELMASFEDGL